MRGGDYKGGKGVVLVLKDGYNSDKKIVFNINGIAEQWPGTVHKS